MRVKLEMLDKLDRVAIMDEAGKMCFGVLHKDECSDMLDGGDYGLLKQESSIIVEISLVS